MSRAIGGRRIAELSDAELRRELEARRRARRGSRGGGPAPSSDGETPTPDRILKYYASLELEPGSSKGEVQDRYLELLDRYDPDRQQDPAKRAVAEELTAKLREAYQGLKSYLGSR